MAELTFGNVPHPAYTNRDIPGNVNIAWADLGPRSVKGVVYHRQLGTNWGTDGWFRLWSYVDPNDGLVKPGGAQLARTDYGVDNGPSGQILRWTDPLSRISGHASGPVSAPYGDGLAFLVDNNWDLRVVNRDQVSIEIAGQYGDPISSACVESVAALSAYWADQFRIPWNAYPQVPSKTYNFTRWHQEYTIGSGKVCPGSVVMQATDQQNDPLIQRTREIMRRYQAEGGTEPNGPVEPGPRFIQFVGEPRIYHAGPAGATARQWGNTQAPVRRQYRPGDEIRCGGLVEGEAVSGDRRWLIVAGPIAWRVHVSGIAENVPEMFA